MSTLAVRAAARVVNAVAAVHRDVVCALGVRKALEQQKVVARRQCARVEDRLRPAVAAVVAARELEKGAVGRELQYAEPRVEARVARVEMDVLDAAREREGVPRVARAVTERRRQPRRVAARARAVAAAARQLARADAAERRDDDRAAASERRSRATSTTGRRERRAAMMTATRACTRRCGY